MSSENNLSHKPSKSPQRPQDFVESLILNQQIRLFQDNSHGLYAWIDDGNTKRLVPILSIKVKSFLRARFRAQAGRYLKTNELSDAHDLLVSIASVEGQPCNPAVRVARTNDALFYDLGSGVVKVTRDRWDLIDPQPGLFRAYAGQLNQVTPSRHVDSHRVRGCINETLDELNLPCRKDRLQLLAAMVNYLIRDLPQPIMVVHGPQGSAKSTLSKYVAQIIDPQVAEHVALGKPREMIQSMSHRWFCPIDNVSGFSSETADLLCMISTGTSFSMRALYTDDDDVFRSIHRPLLLNGICVPSTRADLLDRSILLGLEQISDGSRVGAREVNARLEVARPAFLGALLDLVGHVGFRFTDLSLPRAPRLVEYAQILICVGKYLGYPEAEIEATLKDLRKNQEGEVLREDPIAELLLRVLASSPTNSFFGSASELRTRLRSVTTDTELGDLHRHTRQLQEARSLGRWLERVRTVLPSIGIAVKYEKSGGRYWRLELVDRPQLDVQNVQTPSFDTFEKSSLSDIER